MKHDKITLAHGSGGKLTHELVQRLFLPNFNNDVLSLLGDSALLNINGTKIGFHNRFLRGQAPIFSRR